MIRIIADSTCDLSIEVIKEYGIKLISSIVVVDGQTFNDLDYNGSSLDDFYLTLNQMKEPPSYTPPSSAAYKAAIEEGVFNGVSEFIIFIPSSQQIDDFSNVVYEAIDSFNESNMVPNIKIRVINTLNVSQGFGYTVLKAARMVKEKKSFEEIIEYCETNKNKVKDFFAVPDVDFLYKTGNVTKTAANATKVLGITPVLKLGPNGKAVLASKVVGDNKVAHCFLNEFKHNSDMENGDFVIIGYSTDKERAIEVKDSIINHTDYEGDVYIMQNRPAFGVHIGKRAVSIYFLGKRNSFALFNILRFQ